VQGGAGTTCNKYFAPVSLARDAAGLQVHVGAVEAQVIHLPRRAAGGN
jgi:hypothetical protein